MTTLYPVSFNQGCDNGHIVFIALDREAADQFAQTENDEVQCEILTVDEVALVDNYGYPCQRREARFVAPWIADVPLFASKHYAPLSYAKYVREMSKGG
jgi:hypothetical protein